ncbi:MAG: fatty acid desaturase [Hyphomicrobiales bacterium]|nr:fatty acid desaturase [Hyphomicrobiales bacterium]
MSAKQPDQGLPETRALMMALNRYRDTNAQRSLFELAITVLPLAGLWFVAWLFYHYGYWWASLLVAIPAGGFLVRLFIIQHDCGHGAFLNNRHANDWIGRVLGVFTMTPYDVWKSAHTIHHSSCGDLDRRGIGDIDTLTVTEYRALSKLGKLKYRLYRSAPVLFVIGPAYMFFLQQRIPMRFITGGWKPWVSTQATNIGIAALAAGLIWLVGWQAFLLIHLPIVMIAAMAGVWMFYVQHQFENTIWAKHDDWNFGEASLHGSSFYDLPLGLNWLTGYIGVHHVHHLCSRIPFYRLPEVLRDFPALRQVGRISMLQSLKCVNLSLWDERQRRLVSFRDARLA